MPRTSDDSGRNSPFTLSTTNSTSTESLGHLGAKRREKNVKDLLNTLPSSPKDLLVRMERQRDEIRFLQEENIRLKTRELEVANLTVKLQQQFSATQSQVNTIKTHIQQQLHQPITEEEYQKLDALPESQRDLLDTIKIGIYRQMGSLQLSYNSAVKRAAELSSQMSTLEQDNRDLTLQKNELKQQIQSLKEKWGEQMGNREKDQTIIAELEAKNRELESRLQSSGFSQEEFLKSRLTAQVKTDEVARLAVRLEQSELDVERYKTAAECVEQKLDILKSEYYETKLHYSQKQSELEGALRSANEKLQQLADLEMESQLFITNYSKNSDTASSAVDLLACLPPSRKASDCVSIAKRCLHLENKIALLEQESVTKDTQLQRLQVSLQAARDALHNSNNPYAMIEKTVDEITAENEILKDKNESLSRDNKVLSEKLSARMSDIELLCRHRGELVRIKKLLQKLGVHEGLLLEETEEKSASPSTASDTCSCRSYSYSLPTYRIVFLKTAEALNNQN